MAEAAPDTATVDAAPDLEIVKDDGSTVVVQVKGASGKVVYGIPTISLDVRFSAQGIEPLVAVVDMAEPPAPVHKPHGLKGVRATAKSKLGMRRK